MEQSTDMFLVKDIVLVKNMFLAKDNNLEQMMDDIKKGNLNDILSKLCFFNKKDLMLNYTYFKYLATETTYNYIFMYIINNIDTILSKNSDFILHVNMQKLSLGDIDKHQKFMNNLSIVLKEKYPNKLLKCYIYNAPFMFKQMFNLISVFVDKETQDKIELVKM